MQMAEIEVKFPVEDVAALQSKLPAAGFILATSRRFESNMLYDTPDHLLRNSHQVLRLRQYGDVWTVTHKRHPDNEDPSRVDLHYKVRIETETAVADGAALAEIFARIGYVPTFRYDKFRTEWSQGEAHLVIDETAIGTFAELEGPVEWIDQTLALLDVDRAVCLTDSYGKLFLTWKQRTGSPAENLTWDEISADPVLPDERPARAAVTS